VGEELAGNVPPDTATEAVAAFGTSEAMAPVQGVHTPDVGPDAENFDTGAKPLPGRADHDRA